MTSSFAMTWLTLAAASPCYVATDSSPGWKQVTLAAGAEKLAAPEGVEQFRADEPVRIIENKSGLFLRGRSEGMGVTGFEFTLGEGARSLEIRFNESLRGAKVDVIASGAFGDMSLMQEQRIGASSLSLAWGMNDVRWVKVRVHDHLRKEPVLDGWTSVRVVAVEQLNASAAFRLKHSLYYLQPNGPAVTLCSAPERELVVHPNSPHPTDLPTPVVLRRAD